MAVHKRRGELKKEEEVRKIKELEEKVEEKIAKTLEKMFEEAVPVSQPTILKEEEEVGFRELCDEVLRIAEEKRRENEEEWKVELKKFRETVLKLDEMGFREYLDLPIDDDGNVYLFTPRYKIVILEDGSIRRISAEPECLSGKRVHEELPVDIKHYRIAYKLAKKRLKSYRKKLERL